MPSSYSSYTMLAFGASAFMSGLYTLAQPGSFSSSLNLPAGSEPSVRGNALAAIAMGVYYSLSAVQENRAFFMLSVPIRLLSASTFTLQGGPWITPGVWEGIGALSTAIALVLDSRKKVKE